MSAEWLDQLVAAHGPSLPGAIDRVALRASIRRIAQVVHARGGGAWLLHETDPFRFAAALYGVVLGGGEVTLLPDRQPATVASLRNGVLGAIGVDQDFAVESMSAGGNDCLPSVPPGNVVVLTSGSSGARKPLRRGLAPLLAEADAMQACWPGGEHRLFGSMVSSHHMYGLMFAVVWPLRCGAALCDRGLLPALDFSFLDNARALPVRLVTSPSWLNRLPQALALSHLADGHGRTMQLERLFSAGAPLANVTADSAAKALGTVVNEIYGSSETGAVATRRADLGEAWQALPGVVLAVEQGLLTIDSPFRAEGIPSRFASADAAEHGDDGVRLLGRRDRIVKVEGKRVSLQQIEDLAATHDFVDDCAATLDASGRIALAVALSVAGARSLAEQGKATLDGLLRSALRAAVEPVAVPRRIRYLAEVPRDAQGKAQAERLAPVFEDGARVRPSLAGEELVDGWLQLQLRLDHDLVPFQGHFDDFPVLPGIALVHWAMTFATERLGVRARVEALSDVKFTNVLRPGDALVLALRVDDGRVEYRYSRHGEPCAKGRLRVDADAC